jgi:hypothetical protein
MLFTTVGSQSLVKANVFNHTETQKSSVFDNNPSNEHNLISEAHEILSEEDGENPAFSRTNFMRIPFSPISVHDTLNAKTTEQKKTLGKHDNIFGHLFNNQIDLESKGGFNSSVNSDSNIADNYYEDRSQIISATKPGPLIHQQPSIKINSLQTNRKNVFQGSPKAQSGQTQFLNIKRSASPNNIGKSFLKNPSNKDLHKQLNSSITSQISRVSQVDKNLLISTNTVNSNSHISKQKTDSFGKDLLTPRAAKLLFHSEKALKSTNYTRFLGTINQNSLDLNLSNQGLSDDDLIALSLNSPAFLQKADLNLANNQLTIDGVSIYLYQCVRCGSSFSSLDLRKNKISERIIELIRLYVKNYLNDLVDVDLRDNGISLKSNITKIKDIENITGTKVHL